MDTLNNTCRVVRSSGLEHQLVAARDIKAGEIVLRERPIVHIPVGDYAYGTYAWDMVDRLLEDREKLRTYGQCRLMESPLLIDAQDLVIEGVLANKYRKSRAYVRRIYLGVGTNNVGVLRGDRNVSGYGLYPLLSRADHSCIPNTQLAVADWRAGEASLEAKQDIKRGEVLTWCYFRENEFLPVDWVTRNYNLVNLYRFACRCPRCLAERPLDVPKSPEGLVKYFDKLLYEEAKKASNSPEAYQELITHEPINLHRNALKPTTEA